MHSGGQETIAVTPDVEYGDVKMVFHILESIETNRPVKVDNDKHRPEKTLTTY